MASDNQGYKYLAIVVSKNEDGSFKCSFTLRLSSRSGCTQLLFFKVKIIPVGRIRECVVRGHRAIK
jgi:hypothetical protein